MSSSRTPSELSEAETVGISIDLVAAARNHIAFLRTVAESQWLHQKPILVEAIRRYDELWMPLLSDFTVRSKPPMILPPIDVHFVWYCHTLNPVSYRHYCESRFSKLIGKPDIFDDENEEYALMRCREIWIRRYPSEPFENEIGPDFQNPKLTNEDLLTRVMQLTFLYSKFSEPYMSEIVYLIAAKHRYKAFLYLLERFSGEYHSRLVPTSDILLMWLTHQSYPTLYTVDMKELEEHMEKKVVSIWGSSKDGEWEASKMLWETTFDEPYEKAGAIYLDEYVSPKLSPIYWDAAETDVNTRYKSMLPRFLIEVCIFVRFSEKTKPGQEQMMREFLRFMVVKSHRELKIDKSISSIPLPLNCWDKACHLYCEFGTRGVVLELRCRGGLVFKRSSLEDTIVFPWNDLLRASSLSLRRDFDQKLHVFASITPPVQAAYLLKCVPDRVTDDSGAMISDVILRTNQYRPQEGRWLSRTVLDHAGRECFVVRIRVGQGFWRRGVETPSAVKHEDRVTEIREGSWSYVADSIGRAPEKVVGTATPLEPSEHWKSSWKFSTGDELMIHWQSTAISGMSFLLRNEECPDSSVKLLRGRKMHYNVNQSIPSQANEENQTSNENKEMNEEGEEGFLTLVRYTEENPKGKATALLNWKLLAVELSPEEDAVFALLLCISILRSISEMKKEDIGNLLIRRRLKEAKLGSRDWGSVIIPPELDSPIILSPYQRPWHWNANAVLASDRRDHISRQPTNNWQPVFNYSPAEGGDKLYKQGVIGL